MMFLKNSSGKPDGIFTFAAIGFLVTTFCIIMSMVKSITVKGVALEIIQPSETLLLGYLASTLTAYVTRRNKKDGLESDEKKENLRNGILPAGE